MTVMVLENESIRKRVLPISIDAYHELGHSGKIPEKTELIDGVIIEKMPKDPIHSSIVLRLSKSISKLIPSIYSVRPENPIVLGSSEPEPDIAIVDYDPKEYIYQHPTFAHWIIEVSNTTVALDREKSMIYSKAGIPEYWIINLANSEVEVYKHPSKNGYRYREVFSKDAVLTINIVPEWKFCLLEYIEGI